MENEKLISCGTVVNAENDVHIIRFEDGSIALFGWISKIPIYHKEQVFFKSVKYNDNVIPIIRSGSMFYFAGMKSYAKLALPYNADFGNVIKLNDNYYIETIVDGLHGIVSFNREFNKSKVIVDNLYDEVTLEGDVFCAKYVEEEKELYDVFEACFEGGMKFKGLDNKVSKVKGEDVYYFDNKVEGFFSRFVGNRPEITVLSSKIRFHLEAPEKIESVDVVKDTLRRVCFIKVNCNEYEYCYNVDRAKNEFVLIFKTSKGSKISRLYNEQFAITEMSEDGRVTNLKFLYHKEDESLYSYLSIDAKSQIEDIGSLYNGFVKLYLVDHNQLYAMRTDIRASVKKLCEVDAEIEFKIYDISEACFDKCFTNELAYFIIGYKDGKPSIHIIYDPYSNKVIKRKIKVLSLGFNAGEFVCKMGDFIFVIDIRGSVLFATRGKNVSKKILGEGDYERNLYVIESDAGKIYIFRDNGYACDII